MRSQTSMAQDYLALAAAYGDEAYFDEDASNNRFRNTW